MTRKRITRRRFMRAAGVAIAAGTTAARGPRVAAGTTASGDVAASVREFLRAAVLEKEWIDRFLDPKARVWAKFDPELGYLLRNSFMRDGMDGAQTLARYEPSGERKQVNFPDRPCRINTYGDSFTQGHQVGDGETWQEILAAHFCEPIRNFGVGGFGVYQAWRRLLRTEATDRGAPYLIFNIWGDDHLRSVNAWRWLTIPPEFARPMGPNMFHANPWVHARLDPATGELVDRPNLCPTGPSLYRLCDVEQVHAMFKDDPIVRVLASLREKAPVDVAAVEELASPLGHKGLDFSSPRVARRTAETVYHAYAVRVGMKIVERMQRFAAERGKKLMVLLSYPEASVWHACNNSPPDAIGYTDWHPQVFRDFLAERKIPFVDTLPKHVAEFKTFRLSPKEYIERYYIGHYNPRGNHFFAYAVKDEIVAWLDPRPPAYCADSETLLRFQGYLPG